MGEISCWDNPRHKFDHPCWVKLVYVCRTWQLFFFTCDFFPISGSSILYHLASSWGAFGDFFFGSGWANGSLQNMLGQCLCEPILRHKSCFHTWCIAKASWCPWVVAF